MAIVIPPVYVETEQLSHALSRAVRSIEELGYLRAVHSNLLVFHDGLGALELGAWVDSLTLVNPSRVFLLSLDSEIDTIRVEVGGRCHRVSPSVTLCSEVARLSIPPRCLPGIPSLLRAHTIPGAITETMVLQSEVSPWMAELMEALTKVVYVDSRHCANVELILPRLLNRSVRIVDITWLWLSAWREAIRALCDQSEIGSQLGTIKEITFDVVLPNERLFPVLLLIGWIQDRLGLRFVEKRGEVLLFLSPAETPCSIRIRAVPGSTLAISDLRVLADSGLCCAVQHNSRGFEAQLTTGSDPIVLRGPGEEMSRELLERYFLVGSATASYLPSLEHAMTMAAILR